MPHTLLRRLPEIAWLAVVWVLLWGTFTPLSVVGGVIVAVAVAALFRLPLATDRLPVRPLRVLGLLGYLVVDLTVSAVEVSWQTLRRGPSAYGAILAMPMLSRSDRVMTILANAVSLSPGTMVLQIDHEHDLWYVYTLGPRDRASVEHARRAAMDMQRRVLVAFGAPSEIAEAQRRTAHMAREDHR